MSLQSIVSNAANAAFGTGTSPSGSSLQEFLSKFSDSSGKYANRLDPLNTFEVQFMFHPSEDGKATEDKSWAAKLGDSLKGSLQTAGMNALNNATGGLAGTIIQQTSGKGVQASHDTYSDVAKHSFMRYLLESSLLIGSENDTFSKAVQSLSPLCWNLGYYVQSITIPQIKMPEVGKSTTLVGEFPLNGSYIIPDNFQLQMEILNTKLPIIDRIFYPWMREVTLPFWSYDSQPYTTADIIIDFSKHTDLQYVFYGCRPSQVQLIQPNQENDANFKRMVTFMFDLMSIKSDLQVMDSVKKSLLGTAGTLLNAGAGMLNM